jgi:hypothetical protein
MFTSRNNFIEEDTLGDRRIEDEPTPSRFWGDFVGEAVRLLRTGCRGVVGVVFLEEERITSSIFGLLLVDFLGDLE